MLCDNTPYMVSFPHEKKHGGNMRFWLLNMGDNHAGLRTGLIAPHTELEWSQDDKREVLLSGWSEWLWHDVWMPGLEMIKSMAGDDPVFLLHSGDVTHGSRFIENHYSPHIVHQVHIALESIKPVREIPGFSGFYIVAGTGSHDYGSSSASQKVRDGIAAWGYPVFHSDHINFDFEGFRVDLAHHASYVSKLDHLRENTLRRDIKQLLGHDIEWGRPSAHLYQRGHVHMPVSTTAEKVWRNETRFAQAIITPPLCGPNGYARQATRSMQEVTCGFYLSEVDGERVTIHPWLKNRDTRDYHQVKIELPFHKRKKIKKSKKGKKK